jgi:hypothetical protein
MMEGLHFADLPQNYASPDHEVVLEMKPDARVFKDTVKEGVEILVCGSCGLIAFFATRPDRLWHFYQARASAQRG